MKRISSQPWTAGWIDYNGEIVEAEFLAKSMNLSVRAVMQIAKKGRKNFRLLTLNEAGVRREQEFLEILE